jgi:hypothetical protein
MVRVAGVPDFESSQCDGREAGLGVPCSAVQKAEIFNGGSNPWKYTEMSRVYRST